MRLSPSAYPQSPAAPKKASGQKEGVRDGYQLACVSSEEEQQLVVTVD